MPAKISYGSGKRYLCVFEYFFIWIIIKMVKKKEKRRGTGGRPKIYFITTIILFDYLKYSFLYGSSSNLNLSRGFTDNLVYLIKKSFDYLNINDI
jgi:hypothetical protein